MNLGDYMNDDWEIDENRLKKDVFMKKLIEEVPEAAPYKSILKPWVKGDTVMVNISMLPTDVAQKITAVFPQLEG
jgi:hypothetical protein